jgi:CBS domain-containing protein
MEGFDAQNPPFDRLSRSEMDALRLTMDIGYFAPGDTIVTHGGSSDCLHVIIKGSVSERNGQEIAAVLGPKDTFDAEAVVHGSASASFVAAEETLCYLLPKPTILQLIQKNQGFAAFFYSELSRRLDAFAGQRNPQGLDSVLRSRIRDARCSKAAFISGGTTIEEAGHAMRENNCNSLFVQDGERTGIVTGMNLSKAVVLRRLPLETPVRDICHFDVASVDIDDFLFDALLAMTRHKKRRIAVRANGSYAGILEDIDILELFAGNSQLIPGRIDRAKTVADLAIAARDVQAQVERLQEQGVKIEVIAEITSDLNRNLLAKLFELIGPQSIREHGCLMVMGSEGRGEQTVRTDQDNGLLLAGEVPEPDLSEFRRAFTEALKSFGFPPCPGNVMVRNPLWSQPVDNFIKQLKSWVLTPTGDSAMNLGIFSDAVSVAGNRALLTRAKKAFMEMMRGESVHLAYFAHLIDLFASSDIGRLGNLMVSVGVRPGVIDLKKVGTFPIVHGVRTLAIDKGILETPTVERINLLKADGLLEKPLAEELVSALHVFMELRLHSQRKARRLGNLAGESIVHLNELSSTDRDVLRNALRVVRQFRELVHHRYNLGYF